MPLPCLPSDSATSCSTHSPKDAIFASTTNVSLSRPCRASAPSAAPSHSPLLPSTVEPTAHASAATAAPSSSVSRSTPMSAAGTSPKYVSAL